MKINYVNYRKFNQKKGNLVKKLISMAVLFFFSVLLTAQDQPWTWNYKKVFSSAEIQENNKKKVVSFIKQLTPEFNQLIFSWNARIPEQGYFSFFVQVQDAADKTWHDWHHMLDWGKNVQRSYYSVSDSGGGTYHHVRLELHDKFAVGLRVKIEAHGGASLELLHALDVTISNLTLFKGEKAQVGKSLSSIHIPGVPAYSQMVLDHPKKDVLCSPTATSMMISYFKKEPVNAALFADMVFDNGLNAFGSWPFNTIHAYQSCKGKILFRVSRLSSFVALYEKLQEQIPVVVSVRGKLQGAPKEYNNGHLLIVVGWDKDSQKVICHDPAFEGQENVYVKYDLAHFLEAWERSRRLAYVAEIRSV